MGIKKYLMIIITFLLSDNLVLACINDEFTFQNESIWGKEYSNMFLVNLTTIVVFILLYLFIISLLIKKENKKLNKNNKINTIKKGFFTIIFISLYVFSSPLITPIILTLLGIIPFVIYIFTILLTSYNYIKDNMKKYKIRIILLLVLLFGYIINIFIYFGLLNGGLFASTFLTLYTTVFFSIPIFISKEYKTKTFGLTVLLVFMFISYPALYGVFVGNF